MSELKRSGFTARVVKPLRVPASTSKSTPSKKRERLASGRVVSTVAEADGNADFVAWYRADSMQQIEVVKAGVPARVVGGLARRLHMSNDRLTRLLGLAPATVNRKAKADGRLASAESSRVIGVGRLIGQVADLVEHSGRTEGFDAAKWVAGWIETPVPALGNRRPAELLDTSEGQSLVSTIIARMQSGAYS